MRVVLFGMTAEPDVPDDVGVVAERRIDERRHRPGAFEIEKQPRGTLEAFLIERHFAIELDRHTDDFGEHLALHRANRTIVSAATRSVAGGVARRRRQLAWPAISARRLLRSAASGALA